MYPSMRTEQPVNDKVVISVKGYATETYTRALYIPTGLSQAIFKRPDSGQPVCKRREFSREL